MYKATIIIPISRNDYLAELFKDLNSLEADEKNISLLVVVDGNMSLYRIVQNYVNNTKFANPRCLLYDSKTPKLNYDIQFRRQRIADIHNYIKTKIPESEYVIGFEDDTLMPDYTLDALFEDFEEYPSAGFIQGVEMGRWGIPYVGAWRFDNIKYPTMLNSTKLEEDVQPVDAGGLYCFITKYDIYTNHEFKPFGSNDLGPDVDFGYSLKHQGYEVYTDYDIQCIHRTGDKHISFTNTKPSMITFKKIENRWRIV